MRRSRTRQGIRSRSFVTLLMTLVLVLAVPMLIMLTTFNTSIRVLVQSDYLALNSQIIDHIRNTVDTYVSARVGFAYTLSANRSVRMLAAGVDESPEDTHAACVDIHEFCRSIQSYDRIFSLAAVYLPDRDLVVSSRNAQIGLKEFYERYVGFTGMDWRSFDEKIRSLDAQLYSPARQTQTTIGTSQRLMLYAQPINMGYLRSRAYFLSFIDQEAFSRLFLDSFDAHIHYRLFDENGVELMRSDDFPEAWDHALQPGETRQTLSLGTARYHAFYGQSTASGLQHIFYLPETMVIRQLSVLQRVWLLVAAGSLLIGVCIAVYIARFLHAPLQQMLKQAFPDGLEVDTSSIRQEYHILSEKIRQTQIINERFQQDILAYDAAIRETALMKLATQSRYLTDVELDEASDLCGIPLEQKLYQVVFIERDAGDGDGQSASRLPEAFDEERDGVTVRYTALTATQMVVVCAVSSQELAGETLRALIPSVQGAKVGVSRLKEDIRQLHRALAEASAACMRHCPEQSDYLSNDELYTAVDTIYYPIDKEIQIIAAARNGAYEELRQLLCDIHEHNLRERKLAPQMCASLYNSMISTAMKALEHLHGEASDLTARCMHALSSIDESTPEEEALADTLALYQAICEAARRQNENKKRHIMESVVEFLEANYANPAMCLDMVADSFHVSYYFLSRIFREEAHQSFSDLLNGIRARHAASLLKHTEAPVQVIARNVGYTNINTFLRAFKKREGVTPLQYRKKS